MVTKKWVLGDVGGNGYKAGLLDLLITRNKKPLGAIPQVSVSFWTII